jgi:hypothetical protein
VPFDLGMLSLAFVISWVAAGRRRERRRREQRIAKSVRHLHD